MYIYWARMNAFLVGCREKIPQQDTAISTLSPAWHLDNNINNWHSRTSKERNAISRVRVNVAAGAPRGWFLNPQRILWYVCISVAHAFRPTPVGFASRYYRQRPLLKYHSFRERDHSRHQPLRFSTYVPSHIMLKFLSFCNLRKVRRWRNQVYICQIFENTKYYIAVLHLSNIHKVFSDDAIQMLLQFCHDSSKFVSRRWVTWI